MANPIHRVLTADTELRVELDRNYGEVEVAIVANPATTYFNTTDAAIGAVAGTQDGNHVLSTALLAKTVDDATAGQNSVLRIRSAGTPTVTVTGR